MPTSCTFLLSLDLHSNHLPAPRMCMSGFSPPSLLANSSSLFQPSLPSPPRRLRAILKRILGEIMEVAFFGWRWVVLGWCLLA